MTLAVAAPVRPQLVAAPAAPAPAPKPVVAAPVKVKPTVPRPAPVVALPSGPEIDSATGAVYKNTHVERVEPDGITISYTPVHGGIAITKLNFDELSDDLRLKYGFDPEKKKAYEKDAKQAAAWWRDQLIAKDDEAKAARLAQEKAEADAEKAEKEKQTPAVQSQPK